MDSLPLPTEIIKLIEEFITFRPKSKGILQAAIRKYTINQKAGILKYGNITNWDTSLITDFGYLFYNRKNFNSLLLWDTSRGKNFSFMFYGCINFNKPVNFDFSSLEDASYMFSGCPQFNQNVIFPNRPNIKYDYIFLGSYNYKFNDPYRERINHLLPTPLTVLNIDTGLAPTWVVPMALGTQPMQPSGQVNLLRMNQITLSWTFMNG